MMFLWPRPSDLGKGLGKKEWERESHGLRGVPLEGWGVTVNDQGPDVPGRLVQAPRGEIGFWPSESTQEPEGASVPAKYQIEQGRELESVQGGREDLGPRSPHPPQPAFQGGMLGETLSTPPVSLRSLNGPHGPVTVGFGEAWQQLGGGRGVNEKHIKIQKCAYKISPLVYCLSQ